MRSHALSRLAQLSSLAAQKRQFAPRLGHVVSLSPSVSVMALVQTVSFHKIPALIICSLTHFCQARKQLSMLAQALIV